MSQVSVSGLSARLTEEVELVKQAAGGRSQIAAKPVSYNGVHYAAVWVKNVRLSPGKYNVGSTDLMFLLPADYPATPPIGFYVNFMWGTYEKDQHFLGRSYHSAPDLSERGWYWYCAGLAGGFDGHVRRDWRPTADPSYGHNLATLFVAARYALNTGEV